MMKKVSMNLSEEARKDAEVLETLLNTKNRTQAVESALSLARLIVEKMAHGDEVMLCEAGGDKQYIIIPGLRRETVLPERTSNVMDLPARKPVNEANEACLA
jgi:hypothetical protein